MFHSALLRAIAMLLVFGLLLGGLPPLSPVAAAPLWQEGACLTFAETGGFSVCDDDHARFRTALAQWGVQRVGYPISERYLHDGFVSQAFQKGIMQWRPESNSVALVNIFDDLHHAGYDETLRRRYQTPDPLPDGWDGTRSFTEIVARRQALLDARPALRRAYFAVGEPLTFFGLPTSLVTDMGNHYAIRLQRAVLQEWKEDVPWAKAGEVTVANGGEIARALSALPRAALAVGGSGSRSSSTSRSAVSAPSDPNAWLSVEALRARDYGVEGEIKRVSALERNNAFTRYLIRYPSDGLMIGGFMNIPTGRGPFPVILVNHGYMPRDSYETLTYTTKYADALARAGYLVLHTNYRNHRGSDTGPDQFRVGYAIDVLNLIELAKALPEAQAENIGLWGHSMGGGITLRALTVTDDVKAALVYGSMSADEVETYERRRARWGGGSERARRGYTVLPEEDPALYARISPINYLHHVTAPVAIHHGELDESVPFEWSVRLRDELLAIGKDVEFYAYADQPHNFVGTSYDLLLTRTVAFFDKHLK
ncbi:MAG: alpha/beta fold hydrolase [Chloroflexota bacterium]|nr:alpha/beta fold hydrolase [Chloroflexota bacterium]